MSCCLSLRNMEKLPSGFIERIKFQFPTESEALLASLEDEPKTSIHLHPWKDLDESFVGQTVPWFSRGLILNTRPSFTLDPLFHAGCFYPQESSSMFVNHILTQVFDSNEGLRCLDLCASPGGKSLLISSFLGKGSFLISNEINKTRNQILQENLIKWSAVNTVVTQSAPEKFSALSGYFDLVLTDAPCSGEGMFRKDHAARKEWNIGSAEQCAVRQRTILEDISPAVKEGGILIYSTCTFAEEENERQCEELILTSEWESIEVAIDPSWQIDEIVGKGFKAYRFFPHRIPGEGFFVAVFRKIATTNRSSIHDTKVFRSINRAESDTLDKFVWNKEHLMVGRDEVVYSSPIQLSELNKLASSIYFSMPGIEMGRILRDDFIPAHALALSPLLAMEVNKYEVDLDEALAYLRGDGITPPELTGWCVVQYKTHPLGWVKSLKNRVNNYYPKEYRIRMR
jgi:16S rRNA C967 or C1407 C5-methylase (RsmB/RsmF family)/NOL1/NOP2/fmu family ribosome biogenesis protein